MGLAEEPQDEDEQRRQQEEELRRWGPDPRGQRPPAESEPDGD